MAMVVTINQIIEFPDRLEETVVAMENVNIEGERDVAQTKIYSVDSQIPQYDKYAIKHSKRYKIEGRIWGRDFEAILRNFDLAVYKKRQEHRFAFSVAQNKGIYAHAAFKRLKARTAVKCEPVIINLIQAIEIILEDAPGITINAGWFSHIGLPNLDNVLLQGDDVNRSTAWRRYAEAHGVNLANVELIMEDEDFETGLIKVSLSQRGFMLIKRNLSHQKCLQLADRLVNVLFPEE